MIETVLDAVLREVRSRFGRDAVVMLDVERGWFVARLEPTRPLQAIPRQGWTMVVPPEATFEELLRTVNPRSSWKK